MLNVQNKRKVQADDALLQIADDIGRLYSKYGLALSIGRVFGLLLASDVPLSLDEIAMALGISKSGASVAPAWHAWKQARALRGDRSDGVDVHRDVCAG